MKIEKMCLWKKLLDSGVSSYEIRYRDLAFGCYNCNEEKIKECNDYVPLEVIRNDIE